MDSLEWARIGWLFLTPLALAAGAGSYIMRVKSMLPLAPLQFSSGNKSARPRLLILSILESLLVTLIVIALAGPQKTIRQKILNDPGADLALVLDISASMMADDFKPNRLESLKELTKEFIDKAGHNRYGIYVFAKHVFTQSPLTTDRSSLKQMIDHVNYEMINHATSGGTAIGTALIHVHDNLQTFKEKGRDQAIILITDGESSYGIDPQIAAKQIAASEIRFYAIGMAGLEPVPLFIYGEKFINVNNKHVITSLEDESLKKMTEIARGKYYRAIDEGFMRKILSDISDLEKTPLEINNRISVVSYLPYLSAIILLIAALWFMLYLGMRRPLQ